MSLADQIISRAVRINSDVVRAVSPESLAAKADYLADFHFAGAEEIGSSDISCAAHDLIREMESEVALLAYLTDSCTESECRLCRTPIALRRSHQHHSGIPAHPITEKS